MANQARQKQDWEHVGFILEAPGQAPVGFVLANVFAYMGPMGERALWDVECRDANLIRGGGVRNLLGTQPDGVYQFLDNIQERAEKLGVLAKPLKVK
ncbi:hypothetical protein ACQKEM_13105 [Pseudomonas sp. NPDC077382]